MSCGVSASINLTALQHNLTQVRALVGCECKILAMVKANAYGHGLAEVAKSLRAADGFGVTTLDEGISLRQQGILHPIVLMQGFHTKEELGVVQQYRLTPMLHAEHQFALLTQHTLPSTLDVWVKFETGMNRLGFPGKTFKQIYTTLNAHAGIRDGFVLATHLARADDSEGMTREQIELFSQITSPSVNAKSICNSAAILTYPHAHYDWVRPGIMLYGIAPFTGRTGADFNLVPAMTLTAHIIALNTVAGGEAIGYGGSYTCAKATRVAIVNVGYGDGYPRQIKPGKGKVLIRGESCAILGRVSMDMIAVDVTALAEVAIQDTVTLWGEGLPVEQVAEAAQTIPYELVTKVTARVPYRYH